MGSGQSARTNLGNDCTSFQTDVTGTRVCLEGSLQVCMGNQKEDNHNREIWSVKYETGQTMHSCGMGLQVSYDNCGVESIHLGLCDSADNKTGLALDIKRVGRDGLSGGMIGIETSGSTTTKQDNLIETTLVSYGGSYREGLFVLEKNKKANSNNAYMVTLAHYFVTKDVGLSVAARIFHKKGIGFVVQIEGPYKHPSADLRRVLVITQRTGIWSPDKCSHCERANSGNNHRSHQIVKGDFVSRIGRDQFNRGLINSNGYTKGSGNNCIYFIGCSF